MDKLRDGNILLNESRIVKSCTVRPYFIRKTIVFLSHPHAVRTNGILMKTLTLQTILATRALFHRKQRGLLHRIYLFGAT
jgi:hypothetical protein